MPNLTDVVRVVPLGKVEEPEDIFAFAPGLIFTDDLRNIHGDPGSTIVYTHKRLGTIELRTADPEKEEERQLFSHYLWNASIKMAELVSQEHSEWDVKSERVLELGAGVGLGGIVATLAGAGEVVISDYPSAVVLGNICRNTEGAIPALLKSRYRIEGHKWGEFDSSFARQHAQRFTRILAAECYWMPSQHLSLVRSMLHFLTPDHAGRIFAVAGFPTGRAKLAAFFDVAVTEGLEVEDMYEEDADGVRREWLRERDGGVEHPTERKKWLVIARLKRQKL